MVTDVHMIKMVFIRTNVIYTKGDEDLFVKKTTFRRDQRCILPNMPTYESNHIPITNLLVPDNLYL